jgi:hypothetical protein
MSPFTVTIVVPHAENETVFLLHVVKVALKAYRQNQNKLNGILAEGADDAETGTFDQPPSAIA